MPAPAPLLDEQICFALYNASRAMTARYRDILAPLGITYPQYLVLLTLWESDGMTVSALGERLQLDSGTLSPLLRRLETMTLVVRLRDPIDERSVRVTLSPAGDALRRDAAAIPELVCASTGMDAAELDDLRDRVARLTAAVRATD